MPEPEPGREGGAAAPPAPEGGNGVETLVREPRQARSRRTLDRILETAARLLRTEGPEALTVTGITRRARTSVGSFYARFRGKDDLLRYLGERSLEDALAAWAELRARGSGDVPDDPAVAPVVEAWWSLYLSGPARSLVLLDGIEDPPPARTRRLEARIARDLAEALEVPSLRARVATRAVAGILEDAVRGEGSLGANGAGGSEEGPPAGEEREGLQEELVALLAGYLLAESPAGSPREPEPRADRPSPAGDVGSGAAPEPDPFDVWG